MPAKVIFIAATVIVAAGIVVYENREHVYEFVDRTRRKVANSLQALAHEISPRERVALSSNLSFSGSTAYREDESEKREQEARAEVERSFNEKEVYGFASSSGREGAYNENNFAAGNIRHRGPQFGDAPQDSVVFDASTESSKLSSPQLTPVKVPDFVSRRSSTSTLQQEKPLPQTPPALPPKPQSFISENQSISSEAAVVLDPFTDAEVIQSPIIEQAPAQTNAATDRTLSSTEDQDELLPHPFENSQPYWSIHEWAENTTHTPVSSSPSLAGSAAEEIDQPADDILSDFGSEVESVGSWTEVGSSVSGDDN